MEVNIHEAKTQFSNLLKKVELGEEVIIARAGKPVAKLVAVEETPKPRVLGQARGEVIFHPGWDDPTTEEELAEWGA
jgi:prevent-host-death family protein